MGATVQLHQKELENSFNKFGPLYPVLLDSDGHIIDGEHRNTANDNWPKFKLENVKTEKDRIIVRLVSNNLRRTVPTGEKSMLLSQLAKIILKDGIATGKLGYEIAELTGMSYQWVMKYLPKQFKDNKQSDRAKLALRHGAKKRKLVDPPKGAISVMYYKNTDFVNIIITKSLYEKLAEKAMKWNEEPDKVIYNALLSLQNQH